MFFSPALPLKGAGEPRALIRIILIELFLVICFFALLYLNRDQLGIALLFVPFQILVWALLLKDNLSLLLFFAFIFPLGHIELLPHNYHRYILYPGTIGLLLLLKMTQFLSEDKNQNLPTRAKRWTALPFGLLLLAIFLGGMNATIKGWGSQKLMVFSIIWLEGIILGYCFATIPRSIQEIKRVLSTMAIGVAFSFLCLWFFLILPGGAFFRGKLIETPFGILNLNTVGFFATTFIGIVLGLFLEAKKPPAKIFWLIVLLLLLTTLAISGARGAWLGFGVALLYIMFTIRSFRLNLFIVSGVVLIFLIEPLRQILLMRVSATTADDPALLGRLIFWQYAFKIFKDNWLFGIGAENFKFVKQHYGLFMPWKEGIRYNTHNIYLEVLTDLGVVGFVSFILLLGKAVFGLPPLRRSLKTQEGKGVAVGLEAGLVAFLTHGLLDSFSWQYAAVTLMGALLGLAIGLGNQKSKEERELHQNEIASVSNETSQ